VDADIVAAQPVLFIQGAGDMHEPEGSAVLAGYLSRELGRGYRVFAPEMPDADNPMYRPWRDAIERELAAIDGAVILVGHSFGGSVLLKYLAEGSTTTPIAGIFLVSMPWWGPEGWHWDELDLPPDFASRLPQAPLFLYHSRDDPEAPFAHLGLYADRLPNATSRPITGKEHSFMNGLPEIVDDIRSLK
jgi:uncharacterized protein